MIRIARLTDYALVVLTRMAEEPDRILTSRELAARTQLPVPTVSKVLKSMATAGLVASHRGVAGGYSLAKKPDTISIADVITALEGPIALTMCSDKEGACEVESHCPDRANWLTINRVIRDALAQVTITQMAKPAGNFLTLGGGGGHGPLARRATTPGGLGGVGGGA